MTSPSFAYLPGLKPAFLAHMASRLDSLICTQTKDLLQAAGAQTPVRSVSALLYLYKKGPSSLADIALADGQSHQLVTSRVVPLEDLALVESTPDPADARRKLLALTEKGYADAKVVEHVCRDIAAAFESLFTEIGCDLTSANEEALRLLSRQPLSDRIAPAPAAPQKKRRAP